MKKLFLLAALSLVMTTLIQAQKYAVIDTKYILDKMPDYKAAQKQVDDFAALWQKEIDLLQKDLDKMFRDFESEQVMLTDELKKKREDQLFIKEKNHPGHATPAIRF